MSDYGSAIDDSYEPYYYQPPSCPASDSPFNGPRSGRWSARDNGSAIDDRGPAYEELGHHPSRSYSDESVDRVLNSSLVKKLARSRLLTEDNPYDADDDRSSAGALTDDKSEPFNSEMKREKHQMADKAHNFILPKFFNSQPVKKSDPGPIPPRPKTRRYPERGYTALHDDVMGPFPSCSGPEKDVKRKMRPYQELGELGPPYRNAVAQTGMPELQWDRLLRHRRSLDSTPSSGSTSSPSNGHKDLRATHKTRSEGKRLEDHCRDSKTIYAGTGWITPHPLSVASADASAPQSRIILPGGSLGGQGVGKRTMTLEEWKARKEGSISKGALSVAEKRSRAGKSDGGSQKDERG